MCFISEIVSYMAPHGLRRHLCYFDVQEAVAHPVGQILSSESFQSFSPSVVSESRRCSKRRRCSFMYSFDLLSECFCLHFFESILLAQTAPETGQGLDKPTLSFQISPEMVLCRHTDAYPC